MGTNVFASLSIIQIWNTFVRISVNFFFIPLQISKIKSQQNHEQHFLLWPKQQKAVAGPFPQGWQNRNVWLIFVFVLRFLNILSRLGYITAPGKSVELHLNLLYICDFWEYTQSKVCTVGHMLVDICWHLALISFLLVTGAKALGMSHSPQTSRASRLACTDTIHYRWKCHDHFAELQ